jgi:hypothetical protein
MQVEFEKEKNGNYWIIWENPEGQVKTPFAEMISHDTGVSWELFNTEDFTRMFKKALDDILNGNSPETENDEELFEAVRIALRNESIDCLVYS